jgi:hypothetical protein
MAPAAGFARSTSTPTNGRSTSSFVQGRVLLCGDAAHQFPPTGGLGVNTGLQGMHNAMWKLAFYVHGQAAWALVETYDAERRQVAQRITAQSLQNSMNVLGIFAAAAAGGENAFGTDEAFVAARRYGNHLGVEFGAAYDSSAVVADGTSPPAVEDSYSDYVQCATPGCRAPHVWLGRPGARLSTLDLFGPAFTHSYAVGGTGLQVGGRFAPGYGLEEGGAVLVRPDGHVAWRSARGPASGAALGAALTRILGR